MDVIDRANQLAANGQREAAVKLVRDAAEAGDVVALFALANWRLYGLFGSRDIAEAHRLLDLAHAGGSSEAARLKATLMANGTGIPPSVEGATRLLEEIAPGDPVAAAQLGMLGAVEKKNDVSDREIVELSADPVIRSVKQLLSREECAYLIALAQPEMRPSFVIDPRTGGQMPHPVRTSHGMNFGPTSEEPAVRLLNQRMADATGTKVENGEPLHILRYAPGQQYKPHLDAIPDAGNQRTWTVLVYLNADYTGGETQFDLLGIKHRGEVGDALIFRNVNDQGQLDPRLRHAGLAVESGLKWLATRWIRAKPHDPWTASY